MNIDLRNVPQHIIEKMESDLREGGRAAEGLAAGPLSVLRVLADGCLAYRQGREPVRVDLPLTSLSIEDLDVLRITAQPLRDAFATSSRWPAIGALFNEMMMGLRNEAMLRNISAKRRLREEILGEEAAEPDDPEWTPVL